MAYLIAQGRHSLLKLNLMSHKYIIVSWIISAISVFCVVIQKNNIDKITKVLEHNNDVRQTLEQYVVNSFLEGITIGEQNAVEICNAYMTDSTLVMYLPSSICRACFSSLVLSLQDNDFPFNKISVLSELCDIGVQSECLARGIKNIVINAPVFDVDNIILTMRGRNGVVSMRYNLGDEYILSMFLSTAAFKFYEAN